MIKSIVINSIPHKKQRYDTAGDWQTNKTGEQLTINISEFEDPHAFILLAIHELLEAWRCQREGITEQQVDEFDFAHLDNEDPGLLQEAPYHIQHMQSVEVERLLVLQEGLDWDEYYNLKPIGE